MVGGNADFTFECATCEGELETGFMPETEIFEVVGNGALTDGSTAVLESELFLDGAVFYSSDSAPLTRGVLSVENAMAVPDHDYGLMVECAELHEKNVVVLEGFVPSNFSVHNISNREPRYHPRTIPSVQLSNRVFDIDGDINEIVDRLFGWLSGLNHMQLEFCTIDVLFRCESKDHCSSCGMEIGVYKHCGRNNDGKYVIELLHKSGDKQAAHAYYAGLYDLFHDAGASSHAHEYHEEAPSLQFHCGLPTSDEDDLSKTHQQVDAISEFMIKTTILQVLLDTTCDYASKVEAIRLASCMVMMGNYSSSTIDQQILMAVATLAATNALFHWVVLPAAAIECCC